MFPNPIICFDLYVFAGDAFDARLVVRFCGARSSCELSSEQSSSSDFREQSKAGDGKYHLDILRCAKSKVKQGVLSFDLQPLLLFVFVCSAIFLIDDHHSNRNDNGTSYSDLTLRALMRLGQQSEAKVECSTVRGELLN